VTAAEGPFGPRSTDGSAAGSLGEEAARLAAAVQDWLRGFPDVRRTAGEAGHQARPDAAQAGEVPPECLVCPACQVLRLVRGTRPEVYGHLADAAASLSAALREMTADGAPGAARRDNVEHIDLG
jgi:hypothetical protein